MGNKGEKPYDCLSLLLRVSFRATEQRRESATKARSSTGFKGFATCALAAQKGPVCGFMLCCCHFEIQKNF